MNDLGEDCIGRAIVKGEERNGQGVAATHLVKIIVGPIKGLIIVRGLYVTGFRRGHAGHSVVTILTEGVSVFPKLCEVSISDVRGLIVTLSRVCKEVKI